MKVKDSLLYTETHEWIKIEGDIAIIGITYFAQEQLGDIIYIELPEVGENIVTGNSFGSIESVKTVTELAAPIDGNTIDINKKLSFTPELINKDPYKKGWLIKITIKDKDQIKNLISPEAYEDLTGS